MKTEHSESNMDKVNQHDIKALLEERVLNPKKYADKPLVIWRGYFEDDIQRKVFFDLEYQNKMGKDIMAIPRWITLKLDNLRENALFQPDKGSNPNRVFCLIFDLPDGDLGDTPRYKEYSDIINSDWLKREKEILNAPVVVYLPFLEEPEAFKGYDQCVFIPDFNEWKEELLECKNLLIRHLIGFLENYKSEEERDYRWYWYFQRQKNGENSSVLKNHFEGSGCDFPSCWMWGIVKLRRHFIMPMAQKPKNYIPPKPVKISEIPVDKFKDFFKKGISEDVIEEFRNYLINHNVEI